MNNVMWQWPTYSSLLWRGSATVRTVFWCVCVLALAKKSLPQSIIRYVIEKYFWHALRVYVWAMDHDHVACVVKSGWHNMLRTEWHRKKNPCHHLHRELHPQNERCHGHITHVNLFHCYIFFHILSFERRHLLVHLCLCVCVCAQFCSGLMHIRMWDCRHRSRKKKQQQHQSAKCIRVLATLRTTMPYSSLQCFTEPFSEWKY